jgi:hypothetical protein
VQNQQSTVYSQPGLLLSEAERQFWAEHKQEEKDGQEVESAMDTPPPGDPELPHQWGSPPAQVRSSSKSCAFCTALPLRKITTVCQHKLGTDGRQHDTFNPKTPLFEPFIHKNEHFTKTGSGQTSGKLKKKSGGSTQKRWSAISSFLCTVEHTTRGWGAASAGALPERQSAGAGPAVFGTTSI